MKKHPRPSLPPEPTPFIDAKVLNWQMTRSIDAWLKLEAEHCSCEALCVCGWDRFLSEPAP
jgi:hypothetical protein